MKAAAKRIVVGTRVERPLYLAKARLQRWPNELQKNLEDNLDTYAVMRKVLRSDAACADVGASVGEVLERIVAISPRGQHFAFEPVPASFADLERRFHSYPNVRLYRAAVADSRGDRPFFEHLDDPGLSGLRQYSAARGAEGTRVIDAPCVRLDDVIRIPLSLVKIDTEGAEYSVLLGAIRLMGEHHPYIVFEHFRSAAERYGVASEDVYDLLTRRFSYKVSTMRRWLNRAPAMGRDEFCGAVYEGTTMNFFAYYDL